MKTERKLPPYRVKFDGLIWLLFDENDHIVTFSITIDQLWKNARFFLEPNATPLTPFRHAE